MSRRQAAEALVMRVMSASMAATAAIMAVRAAINPRMAPDRPATPSQGPIAGRSNQFVVRLRVHSRDRRRDMEHIVTPSAQVRFVALPARSEGGS